MRKEKTKVLIVEDSESVQLLLRKIIEDDPQLEVIGIASNGKEALQFLETTPPDVITMDIMMPKMNGFDATRKIMSTNPIPIIIISAKYKSEDLKTGFEALEAGAVVILEKPPGIKDPSFPKIAKNIQTTIRSVDGLKLITRKHHKQKPPLSLKETYRSPCEIIAIGSSLGGPQALKELLSGLPEDFSTPILIVQHISQGFGIGFAEWVQRNTKKRVLIPKNQEIIEPNTIYIAPDNEHMVVKKNGVIHLENSDPVKNLKPAVSKLFSSVNDTYGKKAAAILLSGMGSDGANELLILKNSGALTIAQDEESCLAFGMPGEAVKLNAAKEVLPLEEIAPFLIKQTYLPYSTKSNKYSS